MSIITVGSTEYIILCNIILSQELVGTTLRQPQAFTDLSLHSTQGNLTGIGLPCLAELLGNIGGIQQNLVLFITILIFVAERASHFGGGLNLNTNIGCPAVVQFCITIETEFGLQLVLFVGFHFKTCFETPGPDQLTLIFVFLL